MSAERDSISSLLNTSVSDAKISLECGIDRKPGDSARIAIALLEALKGQAGQQSRRKMAASVVRKGLKILENGESDS